MEEEKSPDMILYHDASDLSNKLKNALEGKFSELNITSKICSFSEPLVEYGIFRLTGFPNINYFFELGDSC